MSNTTLVALLVLTVALLQGVEGGAVTKKRIVGGRGARRRTQQHLAALHIFMNTSEGQPVLRTCTGTMIGQRHLLSAAHCFHNDASNYSAVTGIFAWVGARNVTPHDALYQRSLHVRAVHVHRAYDERNVTSDVAVVTLLDDLYDTALHKVRLPTWHSGPHLLRPTRLYAGGYGWTSDSGPPRYLAREVRLTSRRFRFCYRRSNSVLQALLKPSLVVCASAPKFLAGGADTCVGDSGGPLYTKDAEGGGLLQLGITSFSQFGCGERSGFAWYTNVSSFAPAIKRHVKGNVSHDWTEVYGYEVVAT